MKNVLYITRDARGAYTAHVEDHGTYRTLTFIGHNRKSMFRALREDGYKVPREVAWTAIEAA